MEVGRLLTLRLLLQSTHGQHLRSVDLFVARYVQANKKDLTSITCDFRENTQMLLSSTGVTFQSILIFKVLLNSASALNELPRGWPRLPGSCALKSMHKNEERSAKIPAKLIH